MILRLSVPCHVESTSKSILFSLDSYPYQFGSDLSDPSRLHETFLGSDPNGITFESDPIWVRIADPNGIGSVRSRVNATIKRASLGSDPYGVLQAVCPLERMKIRSIKISIEYPTRVRLFALSKVSKVIENQ